MNPSATKDYARITRAVETILVHFQGDDKDRAALLIVRAAALAHRTRRGSRITAEKLFQLADELACCEGPR